MRSTLLLALLPALLLPSSVVASPRTVEAVLSSYGPDARARLAPYFARLPDNLSPKAAKFIALKAEKKLEIWLQGNDNAWHHLRDYDIEKASGSLRPKMRQGDLLVPEGIYRLDAANPNSKFHLSLRINYPNSLDRHFGQLEQRQDLGGDIFIHGRDVSTGCLAIGDPSIEELFILSHDIGLNNVEVVISPTDPRKGILKRQHGVPEWVDQKYQKIEQSVAELQANRPLVWY